MDVSEEIQPRCRVRIEILGESHGVLGLPDIALIEVDVGDFLVEPIIIGIRAQVFLCLLLRRFVLSSVLEAFDLFYVVVLFRHFRMFLIVLTL